MDNATVISSNSSQNTKKKKVNKYVVMIVLLAVFALAGTGFGIWGMIANGQANQKADVLEDELAQKDKALKQAEEKLGAQIEVEAETNGSEESVANVNVSAAKDYIYIGEWGIKIKVPEDAYGVMYHLTDNLYVTARKGRGFYLPDFQKYAMDHVAGLGALSRARKNDPSVRIEVADDGAKMFVQDYVLEGSPVYEPGEVVYEDAEYYYVYSSKPLEYTSSMDEGALLEASVDMVKEMLETGISAF